MRKKLLAALILASISFHAIAATGHGYVAGEWMVLKMTPGAKGGVREMTPREQEKIFPSKKLRLASPMIAFSTTTVPDKMAKVGDSVMIEAFHHVKIHNTTNIPQHYVLFLELECDNMHEHFTRHVRVEAGGDYDETDTSFGVDQPTMPGKYQIEASVIVAGDARDYSRDRGTLTVTR